MKKFLAAIVAVAVLGLADASAFDPKDLLNGLKGGGSDSTEETTGGKAGGILDALGSMVSNVTANDKFSVDDLVGAWAYTSPAVSFKSDDIAKKIGGAAAATAVESKLEPYYAKLGFNKATLEVDAEHNFVLKLGKIILKGTVAKDETDNGLIFNFSAFGKIPLGKVKAAATKSSSTLNVTFDATNLIKVLTAVSSKVNISTLNAISKILASYDGLYIGFKMKKSATSTK